MKRLIGALVLVIAALTAAHSADGRTEYRIDPERTRIEIHVGRAGFLKMFGHDHLVAARKFSGEVLFDAGRIDASSVAIRIDAGALVVLDPEGPAKDIPEVQRTMLSDQVLDVARWPEIRFVSTAVRGALKKDAGWELTVDGRLALHGAEKTVPVPLRVWLADGALHAKGQVKLRQADFGMTPVKAAGGTVRVKDELTIDLDVTAAAAPSPDNS